MAKWLALPGEPLIFQPSQQEFLKARRARICTGCKNEYQVTFDPPTLTCPKCGEVGRRIFDRLTIIAGRRFGKTRIGAISAVEEALIPGSTVWCCAPTNDKLHRYVIRAIQQIIPQSWVQDWSAEHYDLWLKNGSLIHFQTLEDPDQGRGQGLDALWIDEVCELTKLHWDTIRPSLAGDTVAFFTTSPRGYDWVHDELWSKAENGVPGYWGCLAKTAESANPRISREFLSRERETMSDTMYRQEYEADFVTFTGSVYGEFLKEQHILRGLGQIKSHIPEWPNLDGYSVLVGIDTGADHPFGAVKLVSTASGLVVVGEYLDRDKSFVEHANAIKRLAASPTARFAINKNERQGMIELGQHGILCQPAQNDQVAGIERIKSWLHAGQLFFVEQTCQQTLRQMKAYRWAENTSPKTGEAKIKERVFKKDDELPDCLRYALMTWPALPKPAAPVTGRDLSKLPEKMRQDIEALRRINEAPRKDTSSTGDFFL